VTLHQAKKLAKHAGPTARKFAKHVGPHVIRPARVFWNQVIGFLFAVFALSAFSYALRYYHGLGAEPENGGRIAFSLIFGAIMAWFSIDSFLRARKISRS
jgi:hypothetical protein